MKDNAIKFDEKLERYDYMACYFKDNPDRVKSNYNQINNLIGELIKYNNPIVNRHDRVYSVGLLTELFNSLNNVEKGDKK